MMQYAKEVRVWQTMEEGELRYGLAIQGKRITGRFSAIAAVLEEAVAQLGGFVVSGDGYDG